MLSSLFLKQSSSLALKTSLRNSTAAINQTTTKVMMGNFSSTSQASAGAGSDIIDFIKKENESNQVSYDCTGSTVIGCFAVQPVQRHP